MKPGNTRTPVVILRFHHGSLAIARTLGRWGVDIYGIDADPGNPALSSRYVRERLIWDFSSAAAEESIEFLQDLGRKIGRRALLIATSDHTAEFVADHAEVLSEHFIFPRVDADLVRGLSNKKELYFLARRLDIPTPETAFPESRQDVAEFAASAHFPVMLKAADGLRLEARTGLKMVIVETAEEMLEQYDLLEDPADPNLMIQEYIPGDDTTIWMFEGYFDENSDCVAGFTGQKLRQHPVHKGATSLGVLVENRIVDETTRSFMKQIGYRGVLDIGYRYDARDGRYKLLDPNPRVGSTFRLFVGDADIDVVRLLYLDMTGQPLPRVRPRWGRRWLIEDQDLFSAIDYAREGTLSFRDWFRSFRGVEETAWFARDDLRPSFRVGRQVIARLAGAVWKRVRRRNHSEVTENRDTPADMHADQAMSI